MVIAELDRLTHAALLLLLESTNCFRWLGGSDADTKLGETLPAERPGTQLSTFPPLEYFLEDGDVTPYPYNCSWEEAQSHQVFVIHSSGTTGIPKPLRYTLALAATVNFMTRQPDGTLENSDVAYEPMVGTRALFCAPPKWLGGIIGFLLLPLFWESVAIWPPVNEGGPPTPAAIVEEVIELLRPDGAFYVPSTLRDLCQRPRGLELLRRHAFVSYGGAPLDTWVGDLLCTETKLIVFIGSTETNIWPTRRNADPRDWQYYWLDPRVGHRLEHFRDDLYEMVIDRNPAHHRYQGAFLMFPDRDVYHTQDLYSPHPDRPELIRYRGRRDDLFKLAWLTKVRASDLESALSTNPRVADAMVGGEGRPTPFVIIQPNRSAGDGDGGDDDLGPEGFWPVIKSLNETLSAEVHIPRENIIVTSPDRPLKKLGKGTLDRRSIMSDYGEAVARLYAAGPEVNGAEGKGR